MSDSETTGSASAHSTGQAQPETVDIHDLQPGQKVDAAAVAGGIEVPVDETDDENDAEDPDSDTGPEDASPEADPLDEEGEVAADYLEELLDLADLDGDIDIEVRNGRTYLSVVTEDDSAGGLDQLVGRDGEVLEALQELVRLAVLAGTEQRSRLVLDVAGYRAARAEDLKSMARDVVRTVRDTGSPYHLDPLTPYERKIVHDVVAEEGLHSESEGEGPGRHIVVSTGS